MFGFDHRHSVTGARDARRSSPKKNNGDSNLKTVIGLRWWIIALVCVGTIVN